MLATPLVFLGWPRSEWADAKFYKIRLTLHAHPSGEQQYIGLFEGSDDLWDELQDIASEEDRAGIADAVQVHTACH